MRGRWRVASVGPIALLLTGGLELAGQEFYDGTRSHALGAVIDRSASVTLGDVDGDGDLDALVAVGRHWPAPNRLYLNNGRSAEDEATAAALGYGRFTVVRSLGTEASTSYEIALGDLDGDGDLDAVVANDRAPNAVLLNDGAGRFSRFAALSPDPDVSRGVVLADLDGDGRLDAAVANRGTANRIYLGHGDGTFGSPRTFGTGTDGTIKLSAADLDLDGRIDLVASNRDGDPDRAYLNRGVDRSGAVAFEPIELGSADVEGLASAVGDLDGDGWPDIATARVGAPNVVYFGSADGGFDRTVVFDPGADNSLSVKITDLDRDGDLDLVVGNVGTLNAWFLNRGDGRTFERGTFGRADATYWLAVGDVDADGWPDLAEAVSDGPDGVYLGGR